MALALGDEGLRWLTSEKVYDDVDLTAMVQQHAALIYRVAFSVVRSPAEAEDVVQEVFLRALQHKQQLAKVDSPRAWLLRVAWNLAVDRKRGASVNQLDEKLAEAIATLECPADERLLHASHLARVLRAVDSLPRLERAVLVLGAFEELSVAEIAATLGKSPSSIRSLTFRARTHLQKRLDEQDRVVSRSSGQRSMP